MPTENRSSNTEQMISVPRDEVERLVKLLKYQAHPYPSPHAEFWQGLLDAPAAQHKGDPDRALKDALFACLAAGGDDREYGGVATAGDRQGWIRFTTVGVGAQRQGEPVALPARKDTTQHWAEPGGVHKAEGWNAYHEELARLGPLYTHPARFQQGEPVAFYREFVDGREYCEKPFTNDWTPLYTHAEAGEVERLRAELESVKSSRDAFAQNAIDLRAQLAERDALLKRQPSFINALETFEADDGTFVRLSDVLGALSASAEPEVKS